MWTYKFGGMMWDLTIVKHSTPKSDLMKKWF